MDLLFGAFIVLALALIYVAYDRIYLVKKRRLQGTIIRVILFESVGKDKAFKGVFKALEKTDEILGVYLMINKVKKPIQNVSNTDFFYDRDYGRCLLVCKFSEDDYRVMSTLKNELWFKLVEGKNGKTDYEEYLEPLGITTDGRTASRFNRSFTKRMEQLREEKQGFFEKYAPYIMVGGLMLIMLLSTGYYSNKFEQASENMAHAFGEKADEYLAEVKSPGFAEKLMERIQRKDAVDNAPPS